MGSFVKTEAHFGTNANLANSHTLVGTEYTKEVTDFVDLCYKEGFMVQFDWPEWYAANRQRPIDELNYEDTCRLLTAIVRSDRFNDGALLNALQNGTIAHILQRLKELSEDSG